MIDFLKNSLQITDYETEIDLKEEEKYKIKLNNYLKEIPPNFLSFYNKGSKRIEVENHLKRVYNLTMIEGHIVDTVLKRVISLARVLTSSHRSEYEDKLGQTEYKKDNWNKVKRCQICGYKFKNWQEASLEHVLPLSLGGIDDSNNWQLLCKRCNRDKSSLFGISHINRSYIISDLKVLKHQSLNQQIKSLPDNYRYLVMEKNKRKCSLCENNNTNKELYVTIKDKHEIINFDNLFTICDVCLRSKNIHKTETL